MGRGGQGCPGCFPVDASPTGPHHTSRWWAPHFPSRAGGPGASLPRLPSSFRGSTWLPGHGPRSGGTGRSLPGRCRGGRRAPGRGLGRAGPPPGSGPTPLPRRCSGNSPPRHPGGSPLPIPARGRPRAPGRSPASAGGGGLRNATGHHRGTLAPPSSSRAGRSPASAASERTPPR